MLDLEETKVPHLTLEWIEQLSLDQPLKVKASLAMLGLMTKVKTKVTTTKVTSNSTTLITNHWMSTQDTVWVLLPQLQ